MSERWHIEVWTPRQPTLSESTDFSESVSAWVYFPARQPNLRGTFDMKNYEPGESYEQVVRLLRSFRQVWPNASFRAVNDAGDIIPAELL